MMSRTRHVPNTPLEGRFSPIYVAKRLHFSCEELNAALKPQSITIIEGFIISWVEKIICLGSS